jgi:hypothetical protein
MSNQNQPAQGCLDFHAVRTTVPNALGQAVATVQISGVVQDATGAVVPAARVTATQTATGLTRSAMTDADGSYVMTQLPTGPYQLSVEKAGFKVFVQKGIVIQVGENPTVNVTLELGCVGQSMEVTANAVMVETRETSQSTVIDQARITELPLNGRQPTQLIVLAGGAVLPATGILRPARIIRLP